MSLAQELHKPSFLAPCVHGDGAGFTVRPLKSSDFLSLRGIRLEALAIDGRFYATSYEKERSLSSDKWCSLCIENEGRCILGLFDNKSLIGITMVLPWDEDKDTALLGRTYIKHNYRRLGLSSLLYRGRLNWVKEASRYSSATVFHRRGNFISEKVNKRHGAVPWFSKQMSWANGQSDTGIWYKIDFDLI